MKPINSDNVKTSEFWNTNTEEILAFDMTVGECRELLIKIIDEYKDMLERLRDA